MSRSSATSAVAYAILRTLAISRAGLDAATLARVAGCKLDTVYRTTAALRRAGKVAMHRSSNGPGLYWRTTEPPAEATSEWRREEALRMKRAVDARRTLATENRVAPIEWPTRPRRQLPPLVAVPFTADCNPLGEYEPEEMAS